MALPSLMASRSPSKHSPNPRLEGPRFERSQVAEAPSTGAAGLPGQLHDGVVDDGCALAEFLVGEVSAVQNDAGRRVDNPDRALPTESRGLQQGAVTKRLEPLRKGAGVVRKPIQHLHAPLRRSIRVEGVERPRPPLRCRGRFGALRDRLIVGGGVECDAVARRAVAAAGGKPEGEGEHHARRAAGRHGRESGRLASTIRCAVSSWASRTEAPAYGGSSSRSSSASKEPGLIYG